MSFSKFVKHELRPEPGLKYLMMLKQMVMVMMMVMMMMMMVMMV